jgi:hypothetical protein
MGNEQPTSEVLDWKIDIGGSMIDDEYLSNITYDENDAIKIMI